MATHRILLLCQLTYEMMLLLSCRDCSFFSGCIHLGSSVAALFSGPTVPFFRPDKAFYRFSQAIIFCLQEYFLLGFFFTFIFRQFRKNIRKILLSFRCVEEPQIQRHFVNPITASEWYFDPSIQLCQQT